MSTERGHANMDLDKRADIVTQCIKDKMKDMPGRRRRRKSSDASGLTRRVADRAPGTPGSGRVTWPGLSRPPRWRGTEVTGEPL